MEYRTTTLQRLKCYPTYQFHAEIRSSRLSESEIFRKCILDAFHWLRARLKESENIPLELQTPEPENYADFTEEQLCSFAINLGWTADVSYVPEQGIWAFALREADMGANLGKENERLPVQGRMFETDISFVKCGDCVECGVRTICTEPSGCTVGCEVFRPAVVRALLTDPQFSLSHGGIALNAKPVMITAKADAEWFASVFLNTRFNYPFVLIADAGYEKPKQEPAVPLPKPDALSLQFSAASSFLTSAALEQKTDKPYLQTEKPKPAAKSASQPKTSKKPVRLPEFPYERLAESLKGFGIVCYISEKVFPFFQNKLHLSLAAGDIVICLRGEESERLRYAAYSKDIEACYQQLKSDIQKMPKHRAYDFGRAVFQIDAHLIALRVRQDAAQSSEESCMLYQQENADLKSRLAQLEQQENDLRERNESLRILKKKYDAAQDEISELKLGMQTMQQEFAERQAAYESAAKMIAFYKEKAEIAAGFPTDKDAVCDWAEASFPDTLVITQRARSELRKYHGNLDVSLLCDGLLYLDAYARNRNGQLSDEDLELYTDQRNWEVTISGKETIRLHESEYTVTHEGKQYLLDLHIKSGVRAGFLIRIYFCRDNSGRLIVGSMPEHLATATRSS